VVPVLSNRIWTVNAWLGVAAMSVVGSKRLY